MMSKNTKRTKRSAKTLQGALMAGGLCLSTGFGTCDPQGVLPPLVCKDTPREEDVMVVTLDLKGKLDGGTLYVRLEDGKKTPLSVCGQCEVELGTQVGASRSVTILRPQADDIVRGVVTLVNDKGDAIAGGEGAIAVRAGAAAVGMTVTIDPAMAVSRYVNCVDKPQNDGGGGGNGKLAFRTAPPLPRTGVRPIGGELNNSPGLDLVVSYYNGYGDTSEARGYAYLSGRNNGLFETTASLIINYNTTLGSGLSLLRRGATDDLLAVSRRTISTGDMSRTEAILTWHLNSGDGKFPQAQELLRSTSLSQPVVADFDKKDGPDIAIIDGGTIKVRLSGMGLGDWRQSPAGGLGGALFTGDFDGDGRMDLGGFANGVVTIALGRGDGTFQPLMSTPINGATEVAVGHFNGDGKLDLVARTSNYSVRPLLSEGTGRFRPGAELY